jgi:sec-independent protein translocase protein TatC
MSSVQPGGPRHRLPGAPLLTLCRPAPPRYLPRHPMIVRPILRKLFQFREQKDTEMVKPFLDHLEDLRWTLVKVIATLGLAMVLSFGFRFQLMQVIESPLHRVSGTDIVYLRALGPADSMTVSLSLAFYAGIVLSFPLQLYYLAGFVLPALNPNEKVYVLPAILLSFGLFLSGVFFCFHWVLPATLHWLFYDAKHMGFRPDWTVGTYFSFATQFVLIFGLSFELPVVVIALVKLKILSASVLRKTRAYAMILILALASFIAPTPDPVTMAIVAGPMLVLYEACIWIAWWMERHARKQIMRPTREDGPG